MSQEQPQCPKCRKPVTASQPASITQWLSVCRCGVENLFLTQSLSVHICSKCGKRVNRGRQGSLSQYIFRHDLCSCPVPDPVRTEIEAAPSALAAEPEDDDSEELPLSKEEFPVERYKPLRVVGKGAAGKVYLCRDRLLRKKVAVKMLSTLSASELVAFQEEARALSKLKHANIVSILDFGASQDGLPYMVLEYVPGVTMEQYLDEHGAMPVEDAIFVLDQVCRALDCAHREGIFHRDVKPSNILLVSDEENGLGVRLIDFGVARVRQDEDPGQGSEVLEQGRTLAGTPAYMSPDQAAGLDYDARSEVYSLGCVLFELLTGRPPFEAESPLEMISMHANREPPLVSSLIGARVPGDLEEIIATCLAKDREERFQSISQLSEALAALSQSESAEEETPVGRRPGAILSMVAVAALGGVFISLAWFGLSRGEPGTTGARSDVKPVQRVRMAREAAGFTEQFSSKYFSFRPVGEGGTLSDAELEEVAEMLANEKSILLDLSNSDVHGPGLHFLSKLPIFYLNLSQNSLDLDCLNTLRSFKRLRILKLAQTNLNDDALAVISRIRTIEELDLDGCRGFTDRGVAYLAELPAVQSIILRSTAITDDSLKTLAAIPKIYSIVVEDTIVGDEGLAKISHCRNIKMLYLRNCKNVSARGFALICRNMPWLTELSMGGPGIGPGDLEPVAALKDLENLNLLNCRIGAADLKAIGTLPNLGVLYLSKGEFADRDLKSLYGLKNIRHIGFWECKNITSDGLAELREHLPRHTRIISETSDNSPFNQDVVEMFADQ
ncbi:MAG: protein kinase [Candidatus Obscuribacterales bacterium]